MLDSLIKTAHDALEVLRMQYIPCLHCRATKESILNPILNIFFSPRLPLFVNVWTFFTLTCNQTPALKGNAHVIESVDIGFMGQTGQKMSTSEHSYDSSVVLSA